MNKQPTSTHSPWYKEPWPWFIISIIVISITWGTIQLVIALQKADSVVVDDYYKSGKAINIDLTRDQNALQLAINASILIDDMSGEVRAKVSGQLHHFPETLKLSLLSPLFSDKDTTVTLRRTVSGDYVGQLEKFTPGRYYVQLETLDRLIPEVGYETGWRISRKTDVNPDSEISLQNKSGA